MTLRELLFILFVCVAYSTGSIFVFNIISKTFKNDRYRKYDYLVLLGSYFWFLGLLWYIIWGVTNIVKDFTNKEN